EVESRLPSGLSMAAINGPAACTVSGNQTALDAFAGSLEKERVEYHRLAIGVAAHSEVVDPILADFAAEVRRLKLERPKRPFISNVTGTWIRVSEATDVAYWVRHLRGTVRFGDGVAELLRQPSRLFLEVGPGRTLGGLVKEHRSEGEEPVVLASLPHAREARADREVLLGAAGRLWLEGVPLAVTALHAGRTRHRIALPTYPFERRRYF